MPEFDTTTDKADVDHDKIAADRVTLAATLDPIRTIHASPYRLLSTADLGVVISSLEAFGHRLINHLRGVEQPAVEEPRDEMAASVPNNDVERAQLAQALNPNLGIPDAKTNGLVTKAGTVEVTAPQSLPTPEIKAGVAINPVPAVTPGGGALGEDAIVNDAEQPEVAMNPVPTTPRPVQHEQPELDEVEGDAPVVEKEVVQPAPAPQTTLQPAKDETAEQAKAREELLF